MGAKSVALLETLQDSVENLNFALMLYVAGVLTNYATFC